MKEITLTVYGADVICASCVNAPSSKDTYEWLEAAIARKFDGHKIQFRYVDIEKTSERDVDAEYIEQIQNDELFYPLVTIEDEVIGEGYIQLKPVYSALEQHGYVTAE
ncbi:YuzD family protein [Chryseomicrobium aureum]|uniref:YuzD family protein n=1 Tax=Chryseomicrobium aureum TaxID=1441723 RepID=UPI003595C654